MTKQDIIAELIDLTRYPINDLDSGVGAHFLLDCQTHMAERGWCNLDGFIRTDRLEELAAESRALLPNAPILKVRRNIYQGAIDPNLPEHDPRRREVVHIARQLADDQIPSKSLIKRLYHSDILTEFVRRVQNKPKLFRCADIFQALNIVALEPDGQHAWHYDTTECTVTLLLQAPDEGGEFTFLPNSRSDDDEDREAVDRLLAGDLSHAQSFTRRAGTFTLFRGGYSLHGVTEVKGRRPRITAILTYDEEEGRTISDDINIRIYGERAARILSARG